MHIVRTTALAHILIVEDVLWKIVEDVLSIIPNSYIVIGANLPFHIQWKYEKTFFKFEIWIEK